MRSRVMVFTGVAVLGLLACGEHTAPADEKLDAAWKSLGGSWVVESAKVTNDHEIRMKGVVFTLGKDKSSISQEGQATEMKCVLDLSVAPPGIELTPAAGQKDESELMRGIYKIEGDTLTICWALGEVKDGPDGKPKTVLGKRPTKFSNENAVLMTLKRK